MKALSVIIPTLNEAAVLPALLVQLSGQRGVELEVIVADGGSSDGTPALASGVTVIAAPRGRAAQMNAGALAANGQYLLFLHADSALPSPTLLAEALAALRAQAQLRVAGHFGLRFQREHSGHEYFFRYLEGKTRLNRPGTINGDQGLMLARSYFEELGGYDRTLPFFEDQRIAAKIFAGGRWLLLPGELHTSARRFEAEGHRARYTLMAMTMGLHAAGAQEFFAQAPQLYPAQEQAGALDLRPFMQLARRVIGARGFWKTMRSIGRFVRENTWQLAYARDVRRGDGELRCLRRFERHAEQRLNHILFDLLATLAVSAWFYLLLPLQTWRRPRPSAAAPRASGGRPPQ